MYWEYIFLVIAIFVIILCCLLVPVTDSNPLIISTPVVVLGNPESRKIVDAYLNIGTSEFKQGINISNVDLEDDLLKQFQDLYFRGTRYIIGDINTRQLSIVEDFIENNQDLLVISTSTTDSNSSNVVEMLLPDSVSGSRYAQLISEKFASPIITVYDSSNTWATDLSRYLNFDRYTFEETNLPDYETVIYLTQEMEILNFRINNTPLDKNIILGDSQTFYSLPAISKTVYGMTCNMYQENYNFGYEVYSKYQPLAILNLVPAIQQVEGIYGSSDIRTSFVNSYGPSGMKYYTSNMTGNVGSTALAKWDGSVWSWE